MDKKFLVRDDHIGVFKNFMPNELIDDYINYFHTIIYMKLTKLHLFLIVLSVLVASTLGFSIKEYIKYEYNQVVIFPSKYFHCSQNVENFTSKKSLAMFTDA